MEIHNFLCCIIIECCRRNIKDATVNLISFGLGAIDSQKVFVLRQEIVVVVPAVSDQTTSWHILSGSIDPTNHLSPSIHSWAQYDEIVPVTGNNVFPIGHKKSGKLFFYRRRGHPARSEISVVKILL